MDVDAHFTVVGMLNLSTRMNLDLSAEIGDVVCTGDELRASLVYFSDADDTSTGERVGHTISAAGSSVLCEEVTPTEATSSDSSGHAKASPAQLKSRVRAPLVRTWIACASLMVRCTNETRAEDLLREVLARACTMQMCGAEQALCR